MIWWRRLGKLGTYVKDKRVVDLVHSMDSRFLKIRIKCFDQVNLYISLK